MPGKSEPGVSGMSFWGHLEALRWTLFRMLAVFFGGAVAAFVAMPRIFDRFILGPVSSDFFFTACWRVSVTGSLSCRISAAGSSMWT